MATSSQLSKFDNEIFKLRGVLQRGLLILVARHKVSNIILLVEQLQSLKAERQIEFFQQQDAALIQTQATPLLKYPWAKQIGRNLRRYLIPLIVSAVVHAPILKALVLLNESP